MRRYVTSINESIDALLPSFIGFRYGVLKLYTEDANRIYDALRPNDAITRTISNAAIVVFTLTLLSTVWMLIRSAWRAPSTETAAGASEMLIIPGLNEFIPLSATPYIVVVLLIAAGLHEYGHAIACRLDDIDVDETGIFLLGIIPLAAYVKPNEQQLEDASLPAQMRMVTSGVFMNILLLLAGAFLLDVVPAANLGHAMGSFLSAFRTGVDPATAMAQLSPYGMFMLWFILLNFFLAITNVIPIAILDGGQFVRHLSESASSIRCFGHSLAEVVLVVLTIVFTGLVMAPYVI